MYFLVKQMGNFLVQFFDLPWPKSLIQVCTRYAGGVLLLTITIQNVACLPTCRRPTFGVSSPHDVNILENSPIGTHVASLPAVVATPPLNGISYSISANSAFASSFSVNGDGNVTTAGNLSVFDRELHSSLQFAIIAIGDGAPSDPLDVNVTLTNVNDMPPIFRSPLFTATVAENYTGVAIIVTAQDQDAVPSVLTYSLQTQSGLGSHLDVDSSSGRISVSTPFDYDPPASDRTASVILQATDGVFVAMTNVSVSRLASW